MDNEEIKELIKITEDIEPHTSLSRYPGISGNEIWLPYEEYDDKTTSRVINNAKKAMEISKRFIENWFK